MAALRAHGMGHIVDFVPNHMGVGGDDNAWWLDLLAWGEESHYSDYFDIDWKPLRAELRGKVLLPFLGGQYGDILDAGELRWEYAEGGFALRYYEHRFPLAPPSYGLVLDGAQPASLASFGPLFAALESLPERAAKRDGAASLRRLLAETEDAGARALVERLDAERTTPAGKALIERVVEAQRWRPTSWKVAAEEINYRRFFDVNGLAAMRMENANAFGDAHRLLFELIARGDVDGVRLDHVDGLFDPIGYCALLRERATLLGQPMYLVVEKILAPGPGAAQTLAGRRHDRVRVHERGHRSGGRRPRRARLRPPLPPLHRRHGFVRRGGVQCQAVHPDQRAGGRAQRARDAARPSRAAGPAHARLHLGRADPGPGRDDRGLPDLPNVRDRRDGRAAGPAVHRARDRDRAQARHDQRRLDLRVLAPRAADRSGRRRAARAVRRLRDALPAAHLAGHRQGRRGHRLLPLAPADRAQRGRRRPGPLRHHGRAVPPPEPAPRRAPPARAARHRDARHEARRGRARAPRGAVRDTRRVAGRHRALVAPEPQAPRAGQHAGRVPALPDADRRLAGGTARPASSTPAR